ncbi:flagellin [Bacillus solimangrovi]|uniref:Flagellin n=1 Tax=Bacillus solimangrovi TaxID=1305675 RepID=A0A1E5LJ10_9BACI|nr:flagellin [Bacillus solimangrovi]OEH94018.1 flagellin [Bacillus solimangrovi]
MNFISSGSALTIYRHMQQHSLTMQRSMERLSTGLRINRAADDPAGLAISEKMRAQIRGLNQAQRNAQDGISMIQTAEGALSETHSILQRMRELAVQAANDTNSPEDRQALQDELNQLIAGIRDIAGDTEFNTMSLLNVDRTGSGAIHLQIGANAGSSLSIEIGNMSPEHIGSTSKKLSDLEVDREAGSGGILTNTDASEAIDIIEDAIKQVSSQRSSLGAYSNRLEHIISNLATQAENLQAAESRIRDADMAKEMMDYTKASMLYQVSIALMAQERKQQEMVLKLLEM